MNLKEIDTPNTQSKNVEKVHGPTMAWIVLTTSLLLTVCAWFLSSSYIEKRAVDKFEFKANEIAQAIEDQMLVYEQVLRGGVAFFDSSDFISREEWKIYVSKLNMEKHWPGIQGLGFSIPVRPGDLDKHIAEVRAEGFPNFTVKPQGKRNLYSSIIYLEPFDWRNKRAFGYDMWSNEMRRDAMRKSAETGDAIASGLITLVQETDTDIQKGFLLYIPVYNKNVAIKTPEERMKALKGWVYAAFRTNDLMKGILSSRQSGLDNFTEMEIYDNEKHPDNLLYSSSENETNKSHLFSKQIELNTHGRNKVISIYENENFKADGANLPKYIAIGGVLIDFLLFYVIYALSSVQRKAVLIAKEISREIEEKNQDLEALNNSLKNSEEKVRAIVENTVDGLITINTVGIIQSYNKASTVLFGYTPEEVIGKNIKILMPEPHMSNHDGYLKKFLETRNAKIIGIGREVECLKKDGSTFPADLSISIAKEGENEVFIGVIRDITERKHNENKRTQVLEELKVKTVELEVAKEAAILSSKSKSEFLANMSHEIRTPMTAILGYIDLLKENENIKFTEAMEQVQIIEKNGDHLLTIINDILDLSKIEAGKLELEYAPFCIHEMTCNIQNLLNAKVKEKNIDLSIDIKYPIPSSISADLTRIRQILLNLLGNSIKFTQKGSVTLVVNWKSETSELSFEVIDTGIGMTAEQSKKVFNTFEQADTSITRNFGGTGLGLAITKRLSEMMGGQISMESEYGKGSKFTVSIKINECSDKLLSQAPLRNTILELKNSNELQGHILLVDDNMTNLTLIGKILKKMNLDVECCMNGEEATKILLNVHEDKNFDLVLMDVQMPVMDGLTAARILKQNNFPKPVIALTANNMKGDKEKCLEAGYCDFASKPINKNELFEILNKHLSN